jgi:hypothetical protein
VVWKAPGVVEKSLEYVPPVTYASPVPSTAMPFAESPETPPNREEPPNRAE